ncbi:MAG: 3-keto-disaccharide hydrolase [Bryobacteraceae bacterium]
MTIPFPLRLPVIALLAWLASAIAASQNAAPNALTAEEKQAGWILLFDGKTMQGWNDPRLKTPPGDAWTIEDGCLKAQPKPRITEDLFSDKAYRDFELAWEWRIAPRGNSGLKYRIQDHWFVPKAAPGSKEEFEATVERAFANRTTERPAKGQDYVIGFEYQMTDDSGNRDSLSNRTHTAGSLYDIAAPVSPQGHTAGEWNESRIVLRGNHVEHWLNGVKVVDTTLDSPEERAAMERRWGVAPHVAELLIKQPKQDCPISLQNHGNACWFRSIRIRRL